jgi:nicotinate dehydrogenase subunit A
MIRLTVNGRDHEVDAEPDTPLLYMLRNDLALNGAKFGCGLGQCGACTVIVDGAAVFSCLTPIALLPGRQVTTIEGLGRPTRPARCSAPSLRNRRHNAAIASPAW